MGVGIMRDYKLKRRDLNSSHTLGCSGRNDSKTCIGSSGHAGDTRSGQTWKKPKDLSIGCRCEYYYTVRHTIDRWGLRICLKGVAQAFRLRKKTTNLCACDNEECERGVGSVSM